MKKQLKYIILISIFYMFFAVFYFGKCGSMLIDFSREAYIPYQMINGQTLIKDIFLIYGFFGYFVNYLIYKIQPNFNLIMIEANIISYFILICTYFIVKKFETAKKTILLCMLFCLSSIFSSSAFNFVMPYSYSTLWAVLGINLILFGLLYKKNWIVYLMLGFVAINRIEFFILCLIFVAFYLFQTKTHPKKEFFLILIFPFFNILWLLINKITIADIINNLNYIKAQLYSQYLVKLYESAGVFFESKYFIFSLKKFIILFFVSSISYFMYRYSKILSLGLVAVFFLMIPSCFYYLNLSLIILIVLGTVLYFKKQLKTKEFILVIFSYILASKSLFSVNWLSYSNFGYFLSIFSLYVLLRKYLNKNWLFTMLVIILSAGALCNALNIRNENLKPIKTQNGTFYININDYNAYKELINFLQINIKQKESLIVVPEGQILNIIAKKGWGFYNSTFTPLDFEIFKEKNLISEIKKNKTDYIVFIPRNLSEYGAKSICYDYAVDFCSYIADNYESIKTINDKNKILILKLKK